jgi:hypothetical protein
MRRFETDDYDDLQPSRMEAALGEAEDEVCDGSGEIYGNTTWGYPKDPQNDVSSPCPGCENCEPEEGDDDDD